LSLLRLADCRFLLPFIFSHRQGLEGISARSIVGPRGG
jgi:hypothetical protein